MKFQGSTSKFQGNSKHQSSMAAAAKLKFGFWNLSGYWDLRLDALTATEDCQ